MKTLDEIIQTAMDNTEISEYCPLFNFYIPIANISIFINKKPNFSFEAIETAPYRLDGEIPMVLINFLWLELLFENKFIYKFLYKQKYGITLD